MGMLLRRHHGTARTTEDGKAEAGATATATVTAADPLAGTVPQVKALVADMTDVAALEALSDEEAEGKARAGVYAAIDARILALEDEG